MVFPKPYEEYAKKLKEQEEQKKKEKAHVNNSKESTLRNTFQQAIQFYAFFYNIGLKSKGIDGESGVLIVLKEDYIDVLNQMNRIHESKYNVGRYEVLSKLGIRIYQNDDTVRIIHTTYKQAMEEHELFQWFKNQFPERLCKCPNNRRVYFGNEPRRICGLSNWAEIVNSDDYDIDRALCILRKYRNIRL